MVTSEIFSAFSGVMDVNTLLLANTAMITEINLARNSIDLTFAKQMGI